MSDLGGTFKSLTIKQFTNPLEERTVHFKYEQLHSLAR